MFLFLKRFFCGCDWLHDSTWALVMHCTLLIWSQLKLPFPSYYNCFHERNQIPLAIDFTSQCRLQYFRSKLSFLSYSYITTPGSYSFTVSEFHTAELEAYCNGSWWDATVLKKDSDRYFVHYEKFAEDQDEWVPLGHLRLRSRIAVMADCQNVLDPGVDVCLMSHHPHSDHSHPVLLSPFV